MACLLTTSQVTSCSLLGGLEFRGVGSSSTKGSSLHLTTHASLVPLDRLASASRRLRVNRTADEGKAMRWQGRREVRAEYSRRDGGGGGGGGFASGFLVGGLVCGALAFVFSPQISKAILGENDDGSPRRLPKWLSEDDSLEATRKKMNEKIAELNMAMDSTAARLRAESLAEKMEAEEEEPNVA